MTQSQGALQHRGPWKPQKKEQEMQQLRNSRSCSEAQLQRSLAKNDECGWQTAAPASLLNLLAGYTVFALVWHHNFQDRHSYHHPA